jgi:hypothetical protein
MNCINDQFNHNCPESNAFYPLRYDQVVDWIESQEPDAILGLGWNSEIEIYNYVNQEFMLAERPFPSDEDL